MTELKISIVIPVYRVEAYIEGCLGSIIEQTYTNYECLLVDDRGGDDSIKVAERVIAASGMEDRFRIMVQPQNMGPSEARNRGMREATGDYIMLMDADDRLNCADALQTFAELALKYPGVDIVQGDLVVQNDGWKEYHKVCQENPEYIADSKTTRDLLLDSFPSPPWNRMVRTRFIQDNGIYLEGRAREDDRWRWSLHNHADTCCFTKKRTYWYRTDNMGSITKISDKTGFILASARIIRDFAPQGFNCRSEVQYAKYIISSTTKAIDWLTLKDPKSVLETVLALKRDLNLPFVIRMDIAAWKLPQNLLANKLFSFVYRSFREVVLILTTRK